MEAYQVKMEMENLVCEMAEDFRKIYMCQLTNVSATNVGVSERNSRDIHTVLQDFLPKVSKL